MLDVEQIIKEYKIKGGTDDMIKSNLYYIKCKMYPGSDDIETSLLVNGLFYAAKKWYGPEYEERLKSTIDTTLFYECRESESCIDVEEKLTGQKHSLQEKSNLTGVVGMTLKLDNMEGNYQPVIIYKKAPCFDYVATLAHELFYHQFCRQSNFKVEDDKGQKFYRDGIALLPKGKGLRDNEALNEGFADYNTKGIMKIYTGDEHYKLDPRRLYEPLEQYAELIASCYDKKQLTNMITTGTPSIEELLDTKTFDFNTFSGYLDMYLRTQNWHDIEIADMFFEHFREEHKLEKKQTQVPPLKKEPKNIMLGGTRGNYFMFGTTGIRPKSSSSISPIAFRNRVPEPTINNIRDLENTIRRLENILKENEIVELEEHK